MGAVGGVRLGLWACVVALSSVACSTQGSKLAADGTGSVVATPLARGHHAQELVDSCGEGALMESTADELTRPPYLQAVSTTAATVLVTGDFGEAPMLEVREPSGRWVASVPLLEAAGDATVSATVENLQPGSVYCYSLPGISEATGFATAPEPGVGATVRFIAFGDSGFGSTGQHVLAEQMQELPFDLALHAGDVAYGSGTRGQLQSYFFEVYEPLLRNHAFYPVAGNHDYDTERARPLLEAFALPDNGVEGAGERYFSYDWGDVHFVGLDTEHITDAQIAWLEEDLGASRQPFIVVYGHHPPFSSGSHGSDRSVRERLVPLFERHRVSLVLSGHDHHYERTHPIEGVTYVVTGGGGRGTRAPGRSDFTAFAEGVLHLVHGEVTADGLTLRAIDAVGREFDAVVIEPRGDVHD